MPHPGIMKQSQYDNAASKPCAQPEPSGQVHEQLDQLRFALDTQYDIVQALLSRMEPVAGCLQVPEGPCEAKISSLVPIASRIQSQIERIKSANCDLDRILSNIQI